MFALCSDWSSYFIASTCVHNDRPKRIFCLHLLIFPANTNKTVDRKQMFYFLLPFGLAEALESDRCRSWGQSPALLLTMGPWARYPVCPGLHFLVGILQRSEYILSKCLMLLLLPAQLHSLWMVPGSLVVFGNAKI